jgi:hypothetical protein
MNEDSSEEVAPRADYDGDEMAEYVSDIPPGVAIGFDHDSDWDWQYDSMVAGIAPNVLVGFDDPWDPEVADNDLQVSGGELWDGDSHCDSYRDSYRDSYWHSY